MLSAPPDEFRLSLTQPSGASFNLEWKPPDLEYRVYDEHFDPTRMERSQPTAEQWTVFGQALERAGVWSWQPRYLNPGEAEGVQWQIAVRVGEKALHSYGDNAFPGAAGETVSSATPSPGFVEFLAAVRALTGGLPLE
jgi:hypothetical protein